MLETAATEISLTRRNARASNAPSLKRYSFNTACFLLENCEKRAKFLFFLLVELKIWCPFSHSTHTALCIELCKSLGQFLVC